MKSPRAVTKFWVAGLTIALSLGAVVPSQVVAAPPPSGVLDPSFGTGGTVLTDFGGWDDAALDVAIDTRGRIVTAGYSAPSFDEVWPALDFSVARYMPSGELDQRFGVGGKVLTDVSGNGSTDSAMALAVQRDGRIVVAGSSSPSHSDISAFALARYTPDGALDPTFGSGGKVLTDPKGMDGAARAVAIQRDGKIVAAGAGGPSMHDFALARYAVDGSLDPSFGVGGVVLTDFGSGGSNTWDMVRELAVQSDGRIVAAGYSDAGGLSNIALARYNTDGSLDTTLGSAGKVLTPSSALGGGAIDLVLQRDDKIVVAANFYAADRATDFMLVRYEADGTLDATFGSGGTVLTDFSGSGSSEGLLALAIDRSGRIVAVGRSDAGGSVDVALARYTTDGTLDPRFGVGGMVLTDVNGGADAAMGVAIQHNGKIVAAGSATTNGASDVAVFRYSR